MPNGIFALNYFNAEGTKALTDYWMQMFEKDPELLEIWQNYLKATDLKSKLSILSKLSSR